MAKVISVVNQKGGVGKTNVCTNLGIGLVRYGKSVLVVDVDSQGSLTASLGHPQPDKLPTTLATVMGKVLTDLPIEPQEGILHHSEGVDLLPANIELSGIDISLVNALSRETVLQRYINTVKDQYDVVLLDCQPSLGMLTINALAAADSVIIPVQAEYLPVKGLEQLLQTIVRVNKQINPRLIIDGILLTMVDRTNDAKDVIATLKQAYGGKLRIYDQQIPRSVNARESSRKGVSIFTHAPHSKIAEAYDSLIKEVLGVEKEQQSDLADVV